MIILNALNSRSKKDCRDRFRVLLLDSLARVVVRRLQCDIKEVGEGITKKMQSHYHLVCSVVSVPAVVLVTCVIGPIYGLRVRLELVLVRVGLRLVDGGGVVGFGAIVIVGRLRIG